MKKKKEKWHVVSFSAIGTEHIRGTYPSKTAALKAYREIRREAGHSCTTGRLRFEGEVRKA